jgi:uncharacterized protein
VIKDDIMPITEKVSDLKKVLEGYGSVAVAFSGGVDSSFLAKVSRDLLGENAVALTIDTPFVPRSETAETTRIAGQIGIRHSILVLPDIDASILSNSRERCYLCKRRLFTELLNTAGDMGLQHLIEGSNLDDLDDFRPGMRALRELDVKSPLIEARLTKADIRDASKSLGLSTWDKPSMACLASRIPYDQEITPEILTMVEQAEAYLRQKGIRQLRVRCHDDLARIEVSPEERKAFFSAQFMDETAAALKKIGFRYVAIDADGYRTGKLNQGDK